MALKDSIFKKTPYLVQNTLITFFNHYLYRTRHGGDYLKYRNYYNWIDTLNKNELEIEIQRKKENFFNYTKKNSTWYQNYDFSNFTSIIPLEKRDIIENLLKISTIKEKDGVVSLTGGTTGASMKVIYTKNDMQERFAILDHFRAQHGYDLGKKTAWFSGKNLKS